MKQIARYMVIANFKSTETQSLESHKVYLNLEEAIN